MSDLYFRCGCCGEIIRYGADRLFPETRKAVPPLRKILWNQEKAAGKRMCKKCAARYAEREGIRSEERMAEIVP